MHFLVLLHLRHDLLRNQIVQVRSTHKTRQTPLLSYQQFSREATETYPQGLVLFVHSVGAKPGIALSGK